MGPQLAGQRRQLRIVVAGVALALLVAPRSVHGTPRLLANGVNAGSIQMLDQGSFQAYVDAMTAVGFQTLHVFGQWREMCDCASPPLDINTEPSLGTYDFSVYFQRLDYAINQKSMRVILSFNLAGQLATDPLQGGTQPVLPTFLGSGDVMQYRNPSGNDVIFSGQPLPTKVPRFEKPSVRQAMLDFVTAVVTQFRQRYGDNIPYYGFTFNTTGENEYPLGAGLTDTSPDAAAAFRTWLPLRYSSPQAVSTAWGHSPPFTDFGQIQIMDGAPPPAVGSAPQAYLDFMAYREEALGAFLRNIRDRVHAAGGKVLAQFGSVWDTLAAARGTFGFGAQINGFDLVVVDDAPAYDHLFSMDYTRTNTPAVPFGNAPDAPCDFGCFSGNLAACCNAQTFPDSNNFSYSFGRPRLEAQVSQSYGRGATLSDFANWDNFYTAAFPGFQSSITNAVTLAGQNVTTVTASILQSISHRQLYVHHDDGNYTNQLITTHNNLGAANTAIAVMLTYDLSSGMITTVAGDGIAGFGGDGGAAVAAMVNGPERTALDNAGNLYIADGSNNRIRKVSPAGVINTIAGNGTWGFSGDGGPAVNATLRTPTGVAVDGSGNVYIADYFNQRVRKVDASGVITTYAGGGSGGDGGQATAASLNRPSSIGLDSMGNLYIAEQANNKIRMVNTSGVISTAAGTGTAGFSGDGGNAKNAQLNGPTAVTVDPSSGILWIADSANSRIREVVSGKIFTFAGNGTVGFSGDGGAAKAAALSTPTDVVSDGSNVYIADILNNRVRMVDLSSNIIITFAGGGAQGLGDGGQAQAAQLVNPSGVALDTSANVYVTDQGQQGIRRVAH